MKHISRVIGVVKLAAKAHAPTIMIAGGVASMGVSVVTASSKTLHLEDVLEPHVEKLEQIKKALESDLPGYSAKKAAQDRGTIYGRVVVDMTKLYIVPGVLFVGGAALVFGGHRIMLKRNATLAIAFTGVKKAFDAYRQNVRDEFGPAADQGMLTGHKQIQVVDESGEVAVVNTRDWEASAIDPYNRVFGEGETTQWTKDLSVNKLFVSNQMRMAQILLGNRGHLYLSEVYDMLGFPETDVSRVVGWKERKNPDGTRDVPVIDFGLDRPLHNDWVYTKDNAIYLDFNCQGLIVGGRIQKALEKA